MKLIAAIISSIIFVSSLTIVHADDKKQKYIEAVGKKLKAAVKAGKITEKEAKEKFAELKNKEKQKKNLVSQPG